MARSWTTAFAKEDPITPPNKEAVRVKGSNSERKEGRLLNSPLLGAEKEEDVIKNLSCKEWLRDIKV